MVEYNEKIHNRIRAKIQRRDLMNAIFEHNLE